MTDVFKIGTWIPVSREVYEDIDRVRNPWRYPDHPPDLNVDPFPEWTRLARWARAARGRLGDIAYVVRHGLPEEHDR